MKSELVPENGDPPIVISKDLTVIGRKGFCDVTIDTRVFRSGTPWWSGPTASW